MIHNYIIYYIYVHLFYIILYDSPISVFLFLKLDELYILYSDGSETADIQSPQVDQHVLMLS